MWGKKSGTNSSAKDKNPSQELSGSRVKQGASSMAQNALRLKGEMLDKANARVKELEGKLEQLESEKQDIEAKQGNEILNLRQELLNV